MRQANPDGSPGRTAIRDHVRDVRGKTLTARTTALLVAAVVLAADQLTKVWAVAALSDGPFDIIPGFFRLALVRNPGAAFGLLEGAGSVIALAAIAAAAILLAVPFAYVGWLGIHKADGEPHRSFRPSDGDHDATDSG